MTSTHTAPTAADAITNLRDLVAAAQSAHARYVDSPSDENYAAFLAASRELQAARDLAA